VFKVLLWCTFFLGFSAFGQVQWNKTLNELDLKGITIDMRFIHGLTLSTHRSKDVLLNTQSEGEYQLQYVVVTQYDNHWLTVYPQRAPSFKSYNDKLSAHKVIAMNLEIRVPEYIKVEIEANQGNLNVSGLYRELYIQIDEGSLKMSHIAEQSTIKTKGASVYLNIDSGTVETKSEKGKVVGFIAPNRNHHYDISSQYGPIFLNQ
jgi:hypothetical protein